MDNFKVDKDVRRKNRSTMLVVEENVFEELITREENSCAGSEITNHLSKSYNPDFDKPEFDCYTISFLDQFSAHLSLSSPNDVHMNMQQVSSSEDCVKEVAPAVLNVPLESAKEDAAEEGVMQLRLEMNDVIFMPSECGDSSYDSSASKQSSVISSPCTSFTVHSDDTQSEDLDRADIWVPSLDLDEDSALILENEQFLGIFSSDFPSPSFSATRSLQFGNCTSSPATLHREEANDADEALYWPSECTSYSTPEFDKFMSISPRISTMHIGLAEIRQLNPVMKRLHKNEPSSANKSNEPRRGNVSLGAQGTKLSLDKVQKAAAVPSRLTKASSKHQPSNSSDKRRPPQLKIAAPRKGSPPCLRVVHPLQELEAGDLQGLADNKILIEEFIGLDEFDGHEGISLDSSSNCQFGLCLSPR